MAEPHNPYWDAIRDAVKPGYFHWESPCVGRLCVGRFELDREPGDPPILNRHDYVGKYSWSITNPDAIAFIAEHAHGGLVDPMAGTGYWAYVLSQVGVDCACYDLQPGENPWHKDEELWVEVETLDGALAAEKHPDRTLLLAWPPYSAEAGARTLRAYRGGRVIYIGEGGGGCTGDEDMHNQLEDEWEEVAETIPVQWYGLHDRITVYERRPNEVAARLAEERRVREAAERDSELSRTDELAGDLVPALQTEGDVKTNDRLYNLRWDTSSANKRDSVRNGRWRNQYGGLK